MKRILLFVLMYVCATIGAWAQITYEFGNATPDKSSVTIDGSVATFTIKQAGDLANFNKNSDNNVQNAWNNVQTIIIKGEINSSDVAKFSDDQTYKGRLDLSNATGDLDAMLTTRISNSINPVIFPHGYDLEAFIKKHNTTNNVNYAIAIGNPLTIYTCNGDQGCLNDPLVSESEEIWIYNVQNGTEVKALKSGDAVFDNLYNNGKVVNGQYKNPTTIHFDGESEENHQAVINASNQSDMDRLQAVVNNPKQLIGKLVMTGELANLAYLSMLTVESLDLSGLTNESLDGLTLPNTTGDILLPGTVTYNAEAKTVVAASGSSLDKMEDELSALNNAGKEITSITYPNGSTANKNEKKLTIVQNDQDNIKALCKATNAAGYTLETIEFPNGSKVQRGRQLDIVEADVDNLIDICEAVGESGAFKNNQNKTITLNNNNIYQNGEIIIPETYQNKATDIIKAVIAAGLDFTKIKFGNDVKWNNGSVTPSSTEEQNLANFDKIFTDAGLDVTQVKFSTGSVYSNGKLTVSSSDNNEKRLGAIRNELVNAGFAINTVDLPNNMTWKSSKKLSVPTTATDDEIDTAKATLTMAGFEVEDPADKNIDVKGNYVKVVDGVTIVTLPDGGINGQLKQLLNEDEKTALANATTLKLVGKYTTDNINDLSDLGAKPTTLDLSGAILDQNVKINERGGFANNVETLILPNDPNYTKIPEDFCLRFTALKTVSIPSQIKEIGKAAFKDCTNLQNVDFSHADNLKVIGESAFQKSGISGNLVIPNSVETIDKWAFGECLSISAITIQKGTNLWKDGIKNCAFEFNSEQGSGENNNSLKNVYINEDDPNHIIPCDAHAFGYDNTNGNTNMATVKTRLNYPPNLYWYYVGEWKSQLNGGRLEGQKELDRLKTVVEQGQGQFDGDIVKATPYAQIGWQMFVSSGIPVTAETSWRTYSDIVHVRVPKKVNEVADVYIVCGYDATKGAVLKQMTENDVIPAGTGVVIHHFVTDKTNGGVLMFPHVTDAEASSMSDLRPYRFVSEDDKRGSSGNTTDGWNTDEWKSSSYVNISRRDYTPSNESTSYPNYLEAIHCMGVQRAIYNAENGNYVDYNTLEMKAYKGQKVTYRNFFFGNGAMIQKAADAYKAWVNDPENNPNPNNYRDYTGDQWRSDVEGLMGWGFFRCVTGMYAINSKAFLHYPATVYGSVTSSSDGVSMFAPPAPTAPETETGTSTNAKEMGFIILSSPEEIEAMMNHGIATEVEEFIPDAPIYKNDSYYTIQGVKVNKPTKSGIYIHNGKKIVVK